MGKLKMMVQCPHCGKEITPVGRRTRKKAIVLSLFVLPIPLMGKLTNKQYFCPACGKSLAPIKVQYEK